MVSIGFPALSWSCFRTGNYLAGFNLADQAAAFADGAAVLAHAKAADVTVRRDALLLLLPIDHLDLVHLVHDAPKRVSKLKDES